MRNVIAVLIISLFSSTHPALSSDSPDPMQRDVTILRESFKGPLLAEFEMRGLSKDDAVAASTDALNWLISCWRNRQDSSNGHTKQVMVVRLGGSVIATYASPCMYEFLALVGEPE